MQRGYRQIWIFKSCRFECWEPGGNLNVSPPAVSKWTCLLLPYVAYAEEATGLGWKIAGSDCSSSSSAWTRHLRAGAAWVRGSGGSEEETGSALLEAAALLKWQQDNLSGVWRGGASDWSLADRIAWGAIDEVQEAQLILASAMNRLTTLK